MISAVRPSDIARQYADDVLEGRIVAGRLVRLACQRHLDDLKNASQRGWYFDARAADRACSYFPMRLRLFESPWNGQPFELSPWQIFCTAVSFGWKESSTGFRRFRRQYKSMARKQGKTTWVAGEGLYLTYDDEPDGEFGGQAACAATKKEQAQIVFSCMSNMVQASPSLLARTTIRKSPHALTDTKYKSRIWPVSSDGNLDGLNTHVVIMDELHAWEEKHRRSWQKLTTGSGARRQPMEIIITTAGNDRSDLWMEQDAHHRKIVEAAATGEILDDRTFVYIATIDDNDDPFDPDVWIKANPNLGVSVQRDYLERFAAIARTTPTEVSTFLQYHCNIRVAASEQAFTSDMWAIGNKPLTIQAGADGHGAVDLGRNDDLAAIACCFPVYANSGEVDHWEIISRAWTCRDGRLDLNRDPLNRFVHEGYLSVCDGDQVDYREIEGEIIRLSQQYNIKTWAFDPNRGRELMQRLQDTHGLSIFQFSQGHRFYNEPCVNFVKELKAGRIRHAGEPMLAWQAKNLYFHKNHEGLIKPDKSSHSAKIDGMVATLMAFSECLFAEKQDQGSAFIS